MKLSFYFMMEKRGLSHIEFVLSFVIFIGFIIFAFIFFNPLQSGRTLKSSMDYAWIEVSQEAKAKMETYSVFITSGIGYKIAIKITGVDGSYNASVEDSSGEVIKTYTNDNGYAHFDIGTEDFFRIRYSPIFTKGEPISGTLIDDNDYSISSSKVEEIYFEELFLEINKSYFLDYKGLKTKFNLPNRVDFGFVVRFDNGDEINSLNEIPESLEVLSRRDRVEIIRNSSLKREYADLRVFVW
jgi:hypothetical protein